ncbi:hypothetical protein [Phytohabitans rumicis]|uniref:Uncharacterized protein n=1 Tax=Phytohabitans rumicis TaxID=1076125 RepID=A0A6V8L9J4_9ACTN|nr:hypothetical protein [Phytohabitans rumicis]GFJ92280.1 hypothetical protein Prum_059220 [Phytohabitans rumicis]
MGRKIVHQQRLAWDGARVFVAALESDVLYPWLYRRITALLGSPYGEALADSRRLVRGPEWDRPFVESAKWRVRLEDLLRYHPELSTELGRLVSDVTFRISAPGGAAGRG